VKSDDLEIARFLHLKLEIKKSQIGRSERKGQIAPHIVQFEIS
jgi:hypothetical protein